MAKVTNDYSVVETTDTSGNPRWKVLLAREDLVSTCRSLEEATTMAANLNKDPWFLDRGFTRADRIAAYKKTKE